MYSIYIYIYIYIILLQFNLCGVILCFVCDYNVFKIHPPPPPPPPKKKKKKRRHGCVHSWHQTYCVTIPYAILHQQVCIYTGYIVGLFVIYIHRELKNVVQIYFIENAKIMLFVNEIIFLYWFCIVIQSLGRLGQGDIC